MSRRRLSMPVAVIVAIIASAGVALAATLALTSNSLTTFSADQAAPTTTAAPTVTTTFVVADNEDKLAYRYTSTWSGNGTRPISEVTTARGVALVGTTLYVLDGGTSPNKLFRYDVASTAAASATSRPLARNAAQGGTVTAGQGLAITGNDVWVVEQVASPAGPARVHRWPLSTLFDGDTTNAVADVSFRGNSGNDQPTGLAILETSLYVTDGADDKVYAYSTSTTSGDSANAGTVSKTLESSNGQPLDRLTGAEVAGTSLWTVENSAGSSTDRAHKYLLSALFSAGTTLDAEDTTQLNGSNKDAEGL
jgi:hypothetical protein